VDGTCGAGILTLLRSAVPKGSQRPPGSARQEDVAKGKYDGDRVNVPSCWWLGRVKMHWFMDAAESWHKNEEILSLSRCPNFPNRSMRNTLTWEEKTRCVDRGSCQALSKAGYHFLIRRRLSRPRFSAVHVNIRLASKHHPSKTEMLSARGMPSKGHSLLCQLRNSCRVKPLRCHGGIDHFVLKEATSSKLPPDHRFLLKASNANQPKDVFMTSDSVASKTHPSS
jgi:hypothetical protein